MEVKFLKSRKNPKNVARAKKAWADSPKLRARMTVETRKRYSVAKKAHKR